ncbi:hypothetical protein BK004_01885 [bacterium CG10_46_32]|nr:MAG: hypothetical protein BK004_01885 [bacterium CG10_46_32]
MEGTQQKGYDISKPTTEDWPRERLMREGPDVLRNAELLAIILNTGHKSSIYSDMPEQVAGVLVEDYSKLNKDSIPVSGYCIDILRIALWSLMITDTFYDSIKKVITLGGDTDTFAAVAGALSGCYYGYNGIPETWKSEVMRADYIKELSEKMYLKD